MTHMTMEKKVMTKKGHQIFGQRKFIPREIPGYAYERVRLCRLFKLWQAITLKSAWVVMGVG